MLFSNDEEREREREKRGINDQLRQAEEARQNDRVTSDQRIVVGDKSQLEANLNFEERTSTGSGCSQAVENLR